MRLHLALLLFVLTLFLGGRPLHAADGPPNFLVILCDDLGYGDLHCYGHPTIRTPHLDKLAEEGIRLTACYSASALCSPARAGLLTGRMPTRSGIYTWIAEGNPMHLGQDETTIATVLKQRGYDACHSGKWHLNGLFNSPEQNQPGDHGFDHWFATQNNAIPTHENPRNFVRNGQPVGPLKGYSCQLVADEAINWLKSRTDSSKPFFLNVCFHEPHEQVASPSELVKTYPDIATEQAEYFANVTNMDAAVGRLMTALDELKLSTNTLVVFTSDNGPETLDRYPKATHCWGSAGPLRGMKLHVYDGGIREPGILRWTGKIQPGQVSDVPVSSLDLFPTCCELAGITAPPRKPLDGVSIVPLLNGKKFERPQPLFWHYYGGLGNRQVALRDGDWKLVAWTDQPTSKASGGSLVKGMVPVMKSTRLVGCELYHITDDIGEQKNLADQEPERTKRLFDEAQKLYGEVTAEGPDWYHEMPRVQK
ncbi:sulfatase-like hydrolase/transferase [Planctomicrobium piriforme]|uniref:Arylsulfatase A n=1 Tax=Planctomicrobium piriforme TaxID=1576369 RepID=A0A1I3E4R1_9PLAN|nr:sulfatase-like hydrolase/transferase [Planctomicrobium piriforme]SFH93955.1 arylsulfatase A [Planctomicrobium piriforme]